jgi:hypothetical protein
MEITIYTDSLSVDKAHNQLRVTVVVAVEDMLSQLDAVHKADYTDIRQQYDNLANRHSELLEAYDELREKFDMLDP